MPTAETAAPPATGDTSEDASDDSGIVVDTGPVVTFTGCIGYDPAVCVYLSPDQEGDYAGRWVDVADMDGDGLAELMVAEPAGWGPYDLEVRSRVHLIRHPTVTGPLEDAAFLRIDGDVSLHFPYLGDPSTLIPGAGQLAVNDSADPDDGYVKAFDLGVQGVITSVDYTSRVRIPPPYNEYGFSASHASCQASIGTPALCVATINANTDVTGDNAGQILVYDAPLAEDVFVLDARSQYTADPTDSARFVSGDTDIDGDGVADLVIGAFGRSGVGEVAVLLAPPDGVHRVWDLADATLTGVESGGELGFGVTAGDLDGDGYPEVLAGAPIAAPAGAYAIQGPPTGDRTVTDAEWAVVAADGQWLGYDVSVADFDGDGAADLAVGAPRSVFTATEPGAVYVYLAPAPGIYAPSDASAQLGTGGVLPDAFGMSIDAGDLDGDGRDDLVVGAPRDPSVGAYAGSVTVLYGGGL